jgi:hypothetical protein
MPLQLPDTITTFDIKDLQKCAPTGHTRNGGKLLLVEHPVHGPRWVRCEEWAEAVPRVKAAPLGHRST